MKMTVQSPAPTSIVDEPSEPSPSWGVQLTTALFSAWVLGGLFLDGWAHAELPQLESFFTPWHAVLYSGLLATAGWIVLQSTRGYRRGRRGLRAIPYGYGLGLAGALLFGIAGLSDLAWHTAFGIEEDLSALLSPPHLALGLAAALMITTPARSAWRSGGGEERPSLGAFLPVLLSVSLLAVAAAFFLAYANAFHVGVAAGGSGASDTPRAVAQAGGEGDPRQALELATVLITNILLLVPLLAMLARWRLPLGATTILFVSVAAFSTAEHGFEAGELILAAVVGGVVGDTLIAMLRPSADRPAAFRTVATATPAALWLAYFAVTALFSDLAWPPELWAGAVVLSAFTGLVLGLLVSPPPTSHEGVRGSARALDPIDERPRRAQPEPTEMVQGVT